MDKYKIGEYEVPWEVEVSIRRYLRDYPSITEDILRGRNPYRLRYDSIAGCWLFQYHMMTIGVEPDGYLHS